MFTISADADNRTAGYDAVGSGCSDGTYLYVAIVNNEQNYTTTAILQKIDLTDGSVIQTSVPLPLAHCNDMCYNPHTNEIIAAPMVTNESNLYVIDPNTLTLKETVEVPFEAHTLYDITYNPVLRQYVVLANGKFHITDDDFRLLKSVAYSFPKDTLTAQGVHCTEDYVLWVGSKKGENPPAILVYNWNFELIDTVALTGATEEPETLLTHCGVLYCVYNKDRTGTLPGTVAGELGTLTFEITSHS